MNEALLNELKLLYPINTRVKCVVEHHATFGVFVDIKHPIVKGLIQITDFLDEGLMNVEKYPPTGATIEAVVLGYTQDDRNQIWLSVKPSLLNSSLGIASPSGN